MEILFAFALVVTTIPILVYATYIIAVITVKTLPCEKNKKCNKITVVIPTYNESEVIEHRIKNLKDINFNPADIYIIVVDDGSTDDTVRLAESAFKNYGLAGEVIVKDKRTGTNSSVNIGVAKAKTEIIVTTDADVTFERNALQYAIGRLLSDEKIGAVCGELEPIMEQKTIATGSEKAYRSVYGKMCTWESNIHSTYCFNGPLIVLRKKAFSPIPETHGASDAGMALRIVRNGYRCIYEPNAKFYEYITGDIKQQRRQKLRRSARLLEATIYNIDLLSPTYGKFGSFVFPLRVIMFFIVPAAFFLSIFLWSYLLAQVNSLYAVGILATLTILLLSGRWYPNLISSFIWHQMYLLVSITRMFRKMHIWKAVERKKV